MTGLILSGFTGMAPQISNRQLTDNAAVLAENCIFDRGRLDPLPAITGITDTDGIGIPSAPNADSIFYYSPDLGWHVGQGIDWVGSILPQDVRQRVFFTDEFYPKIKSGSAEYRLGIPRPEVEPAPSITDAGDLNDPVAVENRSYIYTYVDAWGSEGPPSTASASIEVGAGAYVDLVLPGPPVGNYNFGSGAVVRVYRTNIGSVETAFQYVGEGSFGQTLTDNIESDDLQEVLPSEDWIGPPDDDSAVYPDGPLRGLISIPNGSLIGFSGNQVCVSLAYLPHAWPLTYRFSAEYEIVGLAPISNGVLVTTTAEPYILLGNEPDTMVLVKLESPQACKSKTSIVDMGEYAIYAGDDGLVTVQGGQAEVITRGFIDRARWLEDYQPDTIRAFLYEGKYIAYYGDPLDGTGFIFDPRGGTGSFTHISGQVNTGWVDYENDRTIVSFRARGVWRLGAFATGENTDCVWLSKIFRYSAPVSFNTIRVEAADYPVTVTLIAENLEQTPLVIPSNDFHRLPITVSAHNWQVRIETNTAVEAFGMWDSYSEAI